MLSGTVEWAALLALLIPWRMPEVAAVWRGWLLPGLLAWGVLLALSIAFPSDFMILGILLLPPLVTAAWRLCAARPHPELGPSSVLRSADASDGAERAFKGGLESRVD